MSSPSALALALLTTDVHMLETNHVFDHKGNKVFDQVIMWSECPATGKLHVQKWIMIDTPGKYPIKNFNSGKWEMQYYDFEGRVFRKITSKQHHESWGYDREREDKRVWPEGLRIKLPRRVVVKEVEEDRE